MWFFIHNLDGFLWTSVTLLCPCLFVQVPSHGDHPCREFVVSLHELCESHRTSKWETQIKSNHKSRVEMSVAMCRNVSQCVAYVSHMCRIWIWKKTFPVPTLDLPRTCAGPIDRRHKVLAGSVFKAFTYGSRRSEIHCERCCKFYQWRKMSVAIYDPWMDVRWTPPKTFARNSHNQAAVLVRIQFFH